MNANMGDGYLGDAEVVRKIVDYVVSDFLRTSGIDLRAEPTAMKRVAEAAVRARAELAAFPQTSIVLPYIASDKTGAKHLDVTITPTFLHL
jgi:molecular chaperone DnaK